MSGQGPAAGVHELTAGWEVARCEPAEHAAPDRLDCLDWLPALVPGTAAAALRAAGRWEPGDALDFDRYDWWFRVRFSAERTREGERALLAVDGIATVAEVYLNGECVLVSESMFVAHRLEITERLGETNELAIRCLALGPVLRVSRRPRARWRTRLVTDGNLRFFRTMLLGRTPGFAPQVAAVGPWKPIRIERHRGVIPRELRVRSRADADGVAHVSIQGLLAPLPPAGLISRALLELSGPTGSHRAELRLQSQEDAVAVEGELLIDDPPRWWPHTHGPAALYEATVVVHLGEERILLPAGRIGFRSLTAAAEIEDRGIQLQINGVPVFARGAVWTPLDLTRPCSSADELRPLLAAVAAAGMNMLRVPGIGCYEGDAFYDLCDELGILVWQDFMFANLDYPDRDEQFMAIVERETRQQLAKLAHRPSLAVLCGGSEVAQQAAMFGVDPEAAGGPLYEGLLPDVVREAGVDAPYVPSTPWGGDLPFRPDRGVANYYGVGAYRRPLEDARRSEVRFAAECLAFSNVPDEDALEDMDVPGGLVVHHPRWKRGVPRDVGAGWDFEDVRDHYLRLLYQIDPVLLRSTDHARYLELSRHVSGEVMAAVLGEWRRPQSPCGGGLVLWLSDVVPGAGWGLLDHRGRPKVAYHHVRRACAPVAVWSTDEGLGGVAIHVANDLSEPLEAVLRVTTYRDLELPVEEVERCVVVEAHAGLTTNVEALLGRFIDAAWSYRFGPPSHDLIVLSLEQQTPQAGRCLVSQAFCFPVGRPTGRESAAQLGLTAAWSSVAAERACVTVRTQRFAHGVRLHVAGFVPDDDAFSIEPGHGREVWLRRVGPGAGEATGHLSALNLTSRLAISAAGRKH